MYYEATVMKGVCMPEIKLDVAELRAQMGRANINQLELAEMAHIHRNTVTYILKHQKAELETVTAITIALNQALRAGGQPEINPFDLLIPIGFPAPQMAAPAATLRTAYQFE
jgi:hypothetical protein